jgi:hypothetical protein
LVVLAFTEKSNSKLFLLQMPLEDILVWAPFFLELVVSPPF